jgi:hypothetical protein
VFKKKKRKQKKKENQKNSKARNLKNIRFSFVFVVNLIFKFNIKSLFLLIKLFIIYLRIYSIHTKKNLSQEKIYRNNKKKSDHKNKRNKK